MGVGMQEVQPEKKVAVGVIGWEAGSQDRTGSLVYRGGGSENVALSS